LSRFSVSAVRIPTTGVFRRDPVTVPATRKATAEPSQRQHRLRRRCRRRLGC
jgi:hypothetical protein